MVVSPLGRKARRSSFYWIVFRQRNGEKHQIKNKEVMILIAPLFCCNKYKVDSNGFIISKRDNKPMKPSKNHGGYLITTLMIDGKRKTIPIHIAVAKTFLGDKSKDGLEVNHKDGNKENNCVDNLEWITHKENMIHSAYTLCNCIGSDHHQARKIYGYNKYTGELKYVFNSIIECAKELCTNGKVRQVQNCIWRVLSGDRKSYKECIWKYAD